MHSRLHDHSVEEKPAPSRGGRVLYLSYDGLADHIGQSQVLPYLLGCAEAGHRITVISFEKSERMAAFGDAVGRRCSAAGIKWQPRPFRSSPPLLAKAIDMSVMRRSADRALRSSSFDLIHCRSYPAASVGLSLKRRYGVPLLFDMRGFWPDQRREGGRWPDDTLLGRTLFKHWKKVEARLFADADHIVALTSAARDVIAASPHYAGAPISVIPCCADFQLFQPSSSADRLATRAELGIPEDAPVLVYLGSLGTVYRFDAVLGVFAHAREQLPNLKLLFIGSGSAETLIRDAKRMNFPLQSDDVRCVTAARQEVPRWINAGDIGLCFCAPTFSSLGVSATKVGEYLACGLPIIGNEQIGDLARIVEAVGKGYVLSDLKENSFRAAGEQVPGLLNANRAEIRERASRFLDLRLAISAYRRIYDRISRPVSVAA
jgi:glycosyltransferase involved in cell wall biosynthesis